MDVKISCESICVVFMVCCMVQSWVKPGIGIIAAVSLYYADARLYTGRVGADVKINRHGGGVVFRYVA